MLKNTKAQGMSTKIIIVTVIGLIIFLVVVMLFSGKPVPVTGVTLPELAKVADMPGGHIADIAFAPSNPRIVYLSSNVNAMGIWRSDDAGETWQRIFHEGKGGSTHTNRITVHPSDPDTLLASDTGRGSKHQGHIYKSIDGGQTWAAVHQLEIWVRMWSVTYAPSDPEIAYAGDEKGRVFKSGDGGDSWAVVASLDLFGRGVIAIAVSPIDSDTLYVAGGLGGKFFKSNDGGISFSSGKDIPIGGRDIVKEVALSNKDRSVILAATSAGVFVSNDTGVTWVKTLAVHANSIQRAATATNVVYAGTLEGVYKSIDGGQTWTKHSIGIVFEDVWPVAIHPQNEDVVLTGTNLGDWTYDYDHVYQTSTQGEGIYKTTDGGESWIHKTGGFRDVNVGAIAVDPENPNIAYVGTEASRGLYQTLDGGESWELIGYDAWDRSLAAMPHYTMRLATAQGSTVWLTSMNALIKIVDQGKTWQRYLDNQHFHGIRVHPKDPQVVFVGTSPNQIPGPDEPLGSILYTTDGGQTWQEPTGGFPQGTHTSVHDFVFDPFDENTAYVSTSSHETEHIIPHTETSVGIFKSVDLGKTWQEANNGLTTLEVHALSISPTQRGLLFAATEVGMFRSQDGGANWEATGLAGDVRSLVVDPSNPKVVYAGTTRGLYWSPDTGETWQLVTSVPSERVAGLAMDAQGKVLYAAVNGVGVYKGIKK